jgi:CHASE3 domain sensor protein
MNKKIYIGLGIAVLGLLVAGGIYWQSQKVAISPIEPIESEVLFEEQSLNQDIAELEGVEGDKVLEDIEQDLSEIAEEKVVSETPTTPSGKKIETASIENLESELALELSGLSNDLSDLEGGFVNETSLDNLDSGLTSVTE